MRYNDLYTRSIQDPAAFWKEQSEQLAWFNAPTSILHNVDNERYEWFRDGQLNTSFLCLDYHVQQGRAQQHALIYHSAVNNTIEHFSYARLLEAVSRFAGALSSLGVAKGDTVVVYMPMIPEAVISMLACARLGAIHSVVFGGFAPHELAMRINDAEPKVLITASYGIEFDKRIDYMPLVQRALSDAQHQVEHVVLCKRDGDNTSHENTQDFHELMLSSNAVESVPVEATHPLYILYTSGTTGKPKGIIREHGGHAVAMKFTMSTFYSAHAGDVFWAASDVGWVVGHSYIVYGPLIQGCTTVLYEGKPIRTPDAGAFWNVVERHGVNVMFTAPTAIRAIKKEDPEGFRMKTYNLGSLRTLFLAGERCDPPTLHWIQQLLDKPVIDHWWQTESGSPMLGLMMGVEDDFVVKAGSAGLPVCGYDIHVLDEEGHELPAGKEGFVAVKLPLPPGTLPSLWKNHDRFRAGYLEHFPGYYQTGDGGYKDNDGYWYIMGRIDDVINVSGHRLSTGEMEEIVAQHPAVAECAVIGIADELRGQRPIALVLLKDNVHIEEAVLEEELMLSIRENIGAIAYFKNACIVKRLPKTRSGKILRKTMRSIADGTTFSVPSTIDDPAILDEIRDVLRERSIGIAFEERDLAL